MTYPTDFLADEPAEYYHRQSQFLSSHRLAAFRKCPLLYKQQLDGTIPDVDSTAYLVGRGAHTLIVEGPKRFQDEYAVGGPVNPKTGKVYGAQTKAYGEWAALIGKPALTDSQYALLIQMAGGVARNERAMELLADGIPEGVTRGRYCDVPSQARIDLFNPNHGIIDLKTCDDLTWFEQDARRFSYIHQMAFYRAMAWLAIEAVVPVHLVAIEKKAPFRCGVWRIGIDALGIAQNENEMAIHRLAECSKSDCWPTGYEDVRILDYL